MGEADPGPHGGAKGQGQPLGAAFPKRAGLLILPGSPLERRARWDLDSDPNCLPLCRVPFVLLQQWSGDDFLPRVGEQPQQRSLSCLCIRHCHRRSQRGYPDQREVPQNVVGQPRWEKRKGPLGWVVPLFLRPRNPSSEPWKGCCLWEEARQWLEPSSRTGHQVSCRPLADPAWAPQSPSPG